MSLPRHRPVRAFPDARRIICPCDFEVCVHCQVPLQPRRGWYLRKYVQTLKGPLFVAGRSKQCGNSACPHTGICYYARQTLSISLPFSTYGLDVLAWIGWQHEKEHDQFTEIQRSLTSRGLLISERHVGRIYRQFLALLGGMNPRIPPRLAQTAQQKGGLIWAVDALQPEGHGTLLYVLYEVLSETPVSAIALAHATAQELLDWLAPYQKLCAQEWSCPVLATLSDGEEAIIAALRQCWPKAPHQRGQCHFLNNLAEAVLEEDNRLRQRLRTQLGGLPAVPNYAVTTEPAPHRPEAGDNNATGSRPDTTATASDLMPASPTPLFCRRHPIGRPSEQVLPPRKRSRASENATPN